MREALVAVLAFAAFCQVNCSSDGAVYDDEVETLLDNILEEKLRFSSDVNYRDKREITQLLTKKKKAEDESRVLQKIIEHYGLTGNNNTAKADFEREKRAANKDCDKCWDSSSCEDSLCELLCDEKCDSKCRADFENCSNPSPGNVLNSINSNLDENILENIVDKQIKIRKNRKQIYNSKKILKPVELDSEEKKHFGLLSQCVDKGVPLIETFVINGDCPVDLDDKTDGASLRRVYLDHGCNVNWISLFNRAEFFKKCLENFDIDRFYREVRHQTNILNQIRRNIIKYSEDFSIAEVSGGAQMVGGGLMLGLGVIIPPLAPFTSVVGTTLAFSGSGTSLVSTILGANWIEKEAREAKQEMKELENLYEDVVQTIALFLKSVKAVQDVGKERIELENLEEVITTAYINAVPGAIAVTQVATKVGEILYKKFQQKFGTKVANSAFKKFTISLAQSKLITAVTGNAASKGVKKFFGAFLNKGLSAVIPVINIADGIYSIILGAKSSNVDQGLRHEVDKNIRELEYNSDEVIKTYESLGFNQTNKTSTTEPTWINIHKTDGYEPMQLQLVSGESQCKTKLFGSGVGWKSTEDTKDLDDCKRFHILNNTLSIRILEGYGTIDKVQIATNGKFLPCISCEGDNITASSGAPSEWMECKQKIGMKKIKTHTSNKDWAGTSDYIYFHFSIDTDNGERVNCSTGNMNPLNSLSGGQSSTLHADKTAFGTCTDDKLGEALMNRNMDREGDGNVMVTLETKRFESWNDMWIVDLLKAYFVTVDEKQMVITCELCNANTTEAGQGCSEGWGIKMDDETEKQSFKCSVLEPKSPERSLQSFRVKVCDLRYAGSNSDELRMNICKKGCSNKISCCCTTNLFGKGFTRGTWSQKFDGSTMRDDGGEILGQCEGFEVDGSSVDIRWINEESNAVCISEYEFFGEGKAGITSTRHIPFITCKGRQLKDSNKETVYTSYCKHWSDSRHGYCEGWGDWHDWSRVTSDCSYVNETHTVKKIAMKVCDDEKAGSNAKFQAVIQNIDGDRCTTDVFKDRGLEPGQYVEVTDIGDECSKLEIKENRAEVWMVNADGKDNLCLSDVYFDISSSKGETGMLKCRLNDKVKENFEINIIDKKIFGLPMICR